MYSVVKCFTYIETVYATSVVYHLTAQTEREPVVESTDNLAAQLAHLANQSFAALAQSISAFFGVQLMLGTIMKMGG